MEYWLAEARDKSGALWGFLVKGRCLSKPQVVKQLQALGCATEISGQLVDVAMLDLGSLEIRYDATKRHIAGDRFSLEGDSAK